MDVLTNLRRQSECLVRDQNGGIETLFLDSALSPVSVASMNAGAAEGFTYLGGQWLFILLATVWWVAELEGLVSCDCHVAFFKYCTTKTRKFADCSEHFQGIQHLWVNQEETSWQTEDTLGVGECLKNIAGWILRRWSLRGKWQSWMVETSIESEVETSNVPKETKYDQGLGLQEGLQQSSPYFEISPDLRYSFRFLID